jgi:hypothetical protein
MGKSDVVIDRGTRNSTGRTCKSKENIEGIVAHKWAVFQPKMMGKNNEYEM